MKTTYRIFSSILIALVFSSCEKHLDTKIDTSITPEQISSDYSNLWRFGYQPYVLLQDFNGFAAIDNNLLTAITDDAIQTSSSADSHIMTNGSWNAFYNPVGIYSKAYAGIRAANYYLENSNNYKEWLAFSRDTISDHQNQYKRDVLDIGWLRAEAHVTRAFLYLELAKRYGGVPLVTATIASTENTVQARASFDEVIEFIVNEVDTYKDSLQPNWKTYDQAKNGRFTKGAALAIKARALLLSASPLHNPGNDVNKWRVAAEALNDVIKLGQYSLHSNYRDLFIDNTSATSDETIWAIRLGSTNSLERQNYPIGTAGGNSGVTPSHNLVSQYELIGAEDPGDPYKNRDPRLAASIVTNNSTWNNRVIQEYAGGTDDMAKTNASKTGYYLAKFLNSNLNLIQNEAKNRSWIVIRYGEILLAYAEAMNEGFGPDADNGYGLTARQALTLVRNRASSSLPAVTTTNQADFRAAVKHERRVELAFEDYRYWDLLRWKDAETVLNQPLKGVKVAKSGSTFIYTPFSVEQRVFDASKMYYSPIPQAEISRAKGVLTQNFNW